MDPTTWALAPAAVFHASIAWAVLIASFTHFAGPGGWDAWQIGRRSSMPLRQPSLGGVGVGRDQAASAISCAQQAHLGKTMRSSALIDHSGLRFPLRFSSSYGPGHWGRVSLRCAPVGFAIGRDQGGTLLSGDHQSRPGITGATNQILQRWAGRLLWNATNWPSIRLITRKKLCRQAGTLTKVTGMRLHCDHG